MRWLWLYVRARRVLPALVVTAAAVGVVWALWLANAESPTVDARLVNLTVMLAVAAFSPTLAGADDALDHTGSVDWRVRRAAHLLLTAAAVAVLPLLTTVTGARFEPSALVLRNLAGLLGLTALGAALFGAARAWIAPLVWTLATVTPLVRPSPDLLPQVAGWLIQPAGTTAATGCAGVLAAAGLAAYTLHGCPRRPVAETAPDR